MADEIRVPIVASYDDDEAKKAIKDAEKIEKLKPEIEIGADAKDAERKIGEVEDDATRLEQHPVVIELRAEMEQLRQKAADAEATLDKLATKPIDLDTKPAEEALRRTGDVADDAGKKIKKAGEDGGAAFHGSGQQVSDLTGPLGDASGAASDFGGVIEGVGALTEGVFASMGVSAEAFQTALGGIGIAIAAAAAIWTIFKGKSEDAKKAQEKNVSTQKELNEAMRDGNAIVSATKFDELYGKGLDAGKALLGSFEAAYDFIAKGVPSAKIDDLKAKLADLYAARRAGLQVDPGNLDALAVELKVLEDQRAKYVELNGVTADNTNRQNDLATAMGLSTQATDDNTTAADKNTTAAEHEATAQQNYVDKLQETAQALNDEADALNASVTARRSAADATFALHEAEKTFTETVGASDKAITDAHGNLLVIRGILDGVAEAAGNVADQQVRVAEETATANGTTLTATQKLDTWNNSLVTQASQLKGPQRQALLDYIANVNGIPPEKMTAIQAAIDQGKLDEANLLIADASKARTATITADADTTQATTDLDNAAKPRTVSFTAKFNAGNLPGSQNDRSLPGRNFDGTTDRDNNPATGAGRMAPAATTVNVIMPTGSRGVDVTRQVTGHARRAGRRYGGQGVPVARR